MDGDHKMEIDDLRPDNVRHMDIDGKQDKPIICDTGIDKIPSSKF